MAKIFVAHLNLQVGFFVAPTTRYETLPIDCRAGTIILPLGRAESRPKRHSTASDGKCRTHNTAQSRLVRATVSLIDLLEQPLSYSSDRRVKVESNGSSTTSKRSA